MSSLEKPLLKIASLKCHHWKAITEKRIIQNSTAEKGITAVSSITNQT